MKQQKKKRNVIIGLFLVCLAVLIAIVAKTGNKTAINESAETLRTKAYNVISDEDEYADENKYVKFSAFFTKDLDGDGKAEKLLGTCNEQSKTDTLYINIGVFNNGYLKDGKITIGSYSNNFKNKMTQIAAANSVLNSNCIGDNITSIPLKQVNAGTQELLSGIISSYINSPNAYSRECNITLTGTHVDDEGHETKINKTVTIVVDWYGEAKTTIKGTENTYQWNEINRDERLVFGMSFKATTEGLYTKERHMVVSMSDLYGYYPEEVTCTNGTYDESAHELIIDEETNSISSTYNIQVVYPPEVYEHFKDEIEETLRKSIFYQISGYSICYNNDNDEFENPYITKTVTDSISVTVKHSDDESGDSPSHSANMGLVTIESVGENKSGWKKEHFLAGYEEENPENFEYETIYNIKRIGVYSGEAQEVEVIDGHPVSDFDGKVTIKDDNLIIVDGKFKILDDDRTKTILYTPYFKRSTYVIDCTGDTLGNYSTSNFGSTKKISFEEYSALDTDGYVRIYDGNTLVKEFSYDELATYGSENPYIFEEGIKKLKIETSEDINKEEGKYKSFRVKVIKEIDVKKLSENIDRDALINLSSFKTNVTFSGSNIDNRQSQYDYRDVYMEKSIPEIKLTPGYMAIGSTDEKINIRINIPSSTEIKATTSAGWIDGVFVVKIPKTQINSFDINDINIKSAYANSELNVEIDGYGIEDDDENYLVRIFTKNTATEIIKDKNGEELEQTKAEKGFYIDIDANVSIKPVTSPSQERITLFAYNSNCNVYRNETNDIYDLNRDGNFEDIVGYDNGSLSITAPTTFITTQSVSNYNAENEITYSPNVADVTKDTRRASINVLFMNNYVNTISDLVILGKIPFEGNTYVEDSNQSLKSTYSTTMTSEGIVLPDELKDIATVYYSENENPTKELDESTNGWKTKDNINIDKVKTYLVVIDGTSITKGKTYKFSYDVEIPENIGPNNASYSCHTAYFKLETTGGSLDNLFVSPAKVGVRITKYFNLNINKYKENTTHGVKDARYLLTEQNEYGKAVNPRYVVSDNNGAMVVNNLRINQIYFLKEQNAPNYETNSGTIKFRLVEKDDGTTKFEYLEDTEIEFDGEILISTTDDGRPIVTTALEDIPKAKLRIRKIDSQTKEPTKDVIFSLLDNGVGKQYKTDENGYIELILSLDKQYTLRENKATGYFMFDPIEFSLEKNGPDVSIKTDSELFKNVVINNPLDEDFINVEFDIENEPIPTFDLQIQKVSEGNGKSLEGIKFILERDDLGKSAYYTTDENGIINIENLYQFVDGKSVVGNYTIREIETKSGYILDETPIEFKVSEGNDGQLVVRFKDTNKLQNIRNVETEDSKVKLTIANKPLFRLLKINSETNEPIANVEFVIYSINGNEQDFAKDVDGEYVGTQNSNGDYIVTTDEDGAIQLALAYGSYKIVEYNTPEGYEEKAVSENFVIKDNTKEVKIGFEDIELSSDTRIIDVNYIDDLVKLSNSVNSGNKQDNTIYKLQRDLDFKDPDSYNDKSLMDTLTNEEGSGFTPIGRYDNMQFRGTFDGQNHRIDNMYMEVTEDLASSPYAYYAGFFGNTNNATIKNLTVSGKIESVNSNYVAGIVAYGTATIDNCHSEVEIHVTKKKGSSLYISGVAYSRYTSNLITTNCSNKGDITVEFDISSADIYINGVSTGYCYNSYNMGDIIVNTTGNAGIRASGVSSGTATNCFNRGNISLESSVTTTRNSYIYTVAPNAVNCYSTGDTSVEKFSSKYIYVVASSSSNSYYKDDMMIPSTGVTKRSTAISDNDMKQQSFVDSLGNGNWSMDSENKNDGYPIPKHYASADYDFSNLEEENIEINCVEDLVKLSNKVKSMNPPKKYNVKLNKSLDFASGDSYENPNDTTLGYTDSNGNPIGIREALTNRDYNGFYPIGSADAYVNVEYFTGHATFIGTFDGQGNTISNFYSKGVNGMGLFGNACDAEIKNITLSGEIDGTGKSYVAGICGIASGDCIFENCINRCNISGTSGSEAGGIVGIIGSYYGKKAGKITFKSCKNYGSIINAWSSGGIIGNTDSSYGISYIVGLEDCENYGDFSNLSNDIVGGIVGYSKVKVCYINNCHNHAKISGKEAVGGILGRSTGGVQINKCSNEGSITGENYGGSYVGGLVGESGSSTSSEDNYIYNSTNTGLVTGNSQSSGSIGGLIGFNMDYTITGCTNSGDINATNISYIGGLAGNQARNIMYSNNTGNINSNTSDNVYIGGIAGNTSSSLFVSQCHNEGNIVSEGATYEYIGGIIGSAYNGSSISYTYNKGNITTSGDISSGCYWGGIVGSISQGNISYSYNLGSIVSDLSGITNSPAIFCGGIAGTSTGSIGESYNKGIIDISATAKDSNYIQLYVGGIAGSGDSVGESYNTAPITVSTNQLSADSSQGSSVWIGGIVGNGKSIGACYNTGNITNQSISNKSPSVLLGGIAGNVDSVAVSYNTGNINNTANGSNPYSSYNGTNVKVGGVVGNTKTANNVYNWGDVQNFATAATGNRTDYYQVGGISGCSNVNTHSYNTGSVYNNVGNITNNTVVGVGPINGTTSQGTTNMYLESADIVGENTSGDNSAIATAESEEYMKSVNMYMALRNGSNNWKYLKNQYPTLEFPVYIGDDTDFTEITVENTPLKFDITTEIAENKEGRRVGGSVTGTTNMKYTGVYGKKFLEEVDYNGSSTMEIVAEPSEGYQIVSIYIGEDNYVFEADENGKVTIPAGSIKNVKTNCNVVVRFEKIEDTVTIKKVNKNGENLEGAEFSIKEVDSREQPEQSRVGALTPAGATYSNPDTTKKVEGVLGDIQQGYGDYGFELQEDGTYVPNNTVGSYVAATSYFEIDLTGKEGTNYYATLNLDYKKSSITYFYITESPDKPTVAYYKYVNSATNAGNIVSTKLTGGKTYYLHIVSSSSSITPSVVISDVNVYEEKTEKYDFEEVNGKYISTNQGQNNRECNSVVIINTTGLEGKYKIVTNAELSSQEGVDEATLSVSDGRSAPKNIATITGKVKAKDYEYVVDGGATYILFLSYKNGDVDTDNGTDTFTINSIKLELDKSEYYSEEGILTNSKGEILRSLNYGTYEIMETKAPEGYILDETPRTLVVGENTDNTVEIENEKGSEVVAHYYVYGTGEEFNKSAVKLLDDDTLYGKVGEEYTTTPILEINKFSLMKENGEYIIPENATGSYTDETTDVYYYYKKAQPEGTFKIDATKICQENNEVYIEGAEFDVYKVDGENKEKIGTIKSVGNGKYESEDISIEKEGSLTIEIDETVVPENYKAIEPITIELTIEINEDTATYVVTETSLGIINDSDINNDKRNIIGFTIEEPLQEYNYTINYYHDNVLQENETVTTTALYGSTIEDYTDKRPDGYKFEKVKALNENGEEADLPLVIKSDESKNKINVYYVKDEFKYEVHYFYDGTEDETKAELNKVATFGDEITEYTNKNIDGYKLEKAKTLNENGEEADLPLVIKSDESKNKINVYYVKDEFKYEVHYFYDGTEDETKAELNKV
ncbi:MAG: hypothetical protein IJH12_00540, partial [Clostridia bacterium]|nr:hypothetical protein [Clostridia bacterium]